MFKKDQKIVFTNDDGTISKATIVDPGVTSTVIMLWDNEKYASPIVMMVDNGLIMDISEYVVIQRDLKINDVINHKNEK